MILDINELTKDELICVIANMHNSIEQWHNKKHLSDYEAYKLMIV